MVDLRDGSAFVLDVPGPHRDAPTIRLLHAPLGAGLLAAVANVTGRVPARRLAV